ncbi:MAG: hypothetical protein ABJ201_18245, partial [Nisaea sp.]
DITIQTAPWVFGESAAQREDRDVSANAIETHQALIGAVSIICGRASRYASPCVLPALIAHCCLVDLKNARAHGLSDTLGPL